MPAVDLLIKINNVMKSKEFIIEDQIDNDMRDPKRRQARLKAEIVAGMKPGVHNATSLAEPVYTMGDVEALGWMDKEYTHDSSGEVDGWTRFYSGPKPINVLTQGAGGPQLLEPNTLLDDVQPTDQIVEAKAEQFAWVRFEHADTRKVYDYLEEKGFDVVGANNNEILVGSMNKKKANDIRDIIYEFNEGAWVEVKFVSYEDIEHLL